MSFLNPVNEPVLRFSSTDAGAPQINYAARTAGDVKAVLKACLVTGYGAKASAGWLIENETASTADFASPDIDMLDFVLAVNDAASSGTWSYKHQGTVSKSFTKNKTSSGIDNSSPDNGWQLLATKKGFFYMEIVKTNDINNKSARLYFCGLVQSALQSATGDSAGLWAIGINLQVAASSFFKSSETNNNYRVGGQNSTNMTSAAFYGNTPLYNVSSIDLFADIYVERNQAIVARQSGLIAMRPAKEVDVFGVEDISIDNRPLLKLCCTDNYGTYASSVTNARTVAIYLDYWEY